jgi:hypothetical protein
LLNANKEAASMGGFAACVVRQAGVDPKRKFSCRILENPSDNSALTDYWCRMNTIQLLSGQQQNPLPLDWQNNQPS